MLQLGSFNLGQWLCQLTGWLNCATVVQYVPIRKTCRNAVSKKYQGTDRILVWEGHWQGIWGRKIPQRGVQAQSRGGGLGAKLREAQKMLRHEAEC